MFEDSEHCRHDQVARCEAVTIEIRLGAERLGESSQPLVDKFHGLGTAQFRPLLVRVEKIDRGHVHNERLDGVECGNESLSGARTGTWIVLQERLAPCTRRNTGGAVCIVLSIMIGGLVPWMFSPALFHFNMSLMRALLMLLNAVARVLVLQLISD